MILENSHSERMPARFALLVAAAVATLCVLAYGRALSLPFIADDYLQIELGRQFAPPSGWSALALDPLYRCRATSMFVTYWLDSLFGPNPFYFNLASLFLHVLNSLLVFALGTWRMVGWKVSAIAACFFAICLRPSEAVIWFAAVPELLVFFFVLCGFLCWVGWLQEEKRKTLWLAGAYVFFLLGLASKESAVILTAMCAMAVLVHREMPLRRLWAVLPLAIISTAYFAIAFLARDSHQHFNDGTFSLQAPVVEVLVRSMGGLLWVWGAAALALMVVRGNSSRLKLTAIGLAWMVITLLPYAFLTYMVRVPSRHTYLASVGLALIVAHGLLLLRECSLRWRRPWLVPAFSMVIVIHQFSYLWVILHNRYELRAEPTEKLVQLLRQAPPAVYASCFPYSPQIAESVARVISTEVRRTRFVEGAEASMRTDAVDFCNSLVHH